MNILTSTAESDGTGSSLHVAMPIGAAAGDYAVVSMMSTGSFSYTFTSGWTLIVDAFNGANLPLRVFGKKLVSGDLATGFTVTGSAGSGNPWMLQMVVADAPGGTGLRSIGGNAVGNFTFSVTGTTNTGALHGPYPTPQSGDTLIYIGAGYAVPPPTPPTAINVSLSAGTLVSSFPGTFVTFFGSYLQLLVNRDVAVSAGNASVTAIVSTNNGAGAIVVAFGSSADTFPAWLAVNEPSLGLTDRSSWLFMGEGGTHSFNLQMRQRGQASYTLISDPHDPRTAPSNYVPVIGEPIYIYDQNASGYTLVFAGLIQDYTFRQIGIDGAHYFDVNAVSLESIFDTVYAQPVQYLNKTAGFIVADLFARFESGSQVGLGTIQAGATLPLFNANIGDKLSDLFNQLATTSQFTWNVNARTQELFFGLPSAVAAPFTLTSTLSLWDTIQVKIDGADYRNRQGVKLNYDAFGVSSEYFVGAGQQSFTLARPVEQVTNAYVTLSTCNTATGTFTANPSPGDTITIGPANGAWVATHIYALGGTITVGGYVQKVTFAGTSGGSIPSFSIITGQTTTDNSVIWTCLGPAGLSTGTDTYTFVSALDNTQFGQVLIGAADTDTLLNLVDAINAKVASRGVTFSLPTWECSQCNAINVSGTHFTLQQKFAGTGWVAQISTTASAFSWSGAFTSGGTSPQGSVGPGQGATISLQVYTSGSSTAAPGLAYTVGSPVVTLATPLNSGTNLNIAYTRTDGNVIQVEDTALVTALASVTHGTGKVQQFTDQSSTGLIATSSASGLQFAQQALEAYDVVPQEFSVELYQPGLLPGQQFIVALDGALATFNGTYFIEEVSAQLVPTYPYLDSPHAIGAGHYRYTIRLIDIAQIASYMDFWQGLGGGKGGGGGALVATSGGGLSVPPGTVFPLDFSNQNFTSRTFAGGQGIDYDLVNFEASSFANCTLTGRMPGANFRFAGSFSGTVFNGDFSGSDFLDSGSFSGATASGCGFRACNFAGAVLDGVNASGSDFTGANFNGASMIGCNLSQALFAGCVFTAVNFTGSNLQGCDFTGCKFLNCTLGGVDFTGAPGAIGGLGSTFLNAATFINCDMSGAQAKFTGADLTGAGFFQSGAGIAPFPDFSGCNFTAVRFCDVPNGTGYELVKILTASYTVQQWDANKLLSIADTSPHTAVTITLPAASPSDTWQMAVQNASSFPVTLSPNGRTLDGTAGSLTIPAGSGVQIYSNGTNYFTERGLGSNPTPTWTQETPSGTMNGTNKIFTLSATPSASSLNLILNGVVQDLSVDYTFATATITYTVAPKSADQMKAVYTH